MIHGMKKVSLALLAAGVVAYNPVYASVGLNGEGIHYKLSGQNPQSFSGMHQPVYVQTIAPPEQQERVILVLSETALQPFERTLNQQYSAGLAKTAAFSQQQSNQLKSQQNKLKLQQQQLLSSLSGSGVRYQLKHSFSKQINALAISVPKKQKPLLARLPGVKSVQPDHRVIASINTSIPYLEVPSLWQMKDNSGNSLTGQDIKVGIIDTGIDYTHTDLGGCFGTSCKVAGGYDFVNSDNDPMDDNVHGTHVAATVAANGSMKGVAPDATLYAYKVLDSGGSGWDSDVIAAIERSVEDGMDVINLSLGSGAGPDSPASIATNEAMKAGVIVVAAAGNSGPGYATVGAPGNAKDIITVGASDTQGNMAWFSSKGPVPGYEYQKPEIIAPGVDIVAAAPGQNYASLSGTSMAAPHVAGIAALAKQFKPNYSSQQIKQLLLSQSKSLGANIYTQGVGLIQPAAMIYNSLLSSPAVLNFGRIHASQSNWSGQTQFTLQNTAARAIQVTLQPSANLPLGLTLSGLPQGEFSLAAGAQQVFTLSLTANNQLLGFPNNDTGTFEFAIELQTDGEDRLIPVVASKSFSLSLQQSDGLVHSVYALKTDGSYRTSSDFNTPTATLQLAPGTYHLFAVNSVNGQFGLVSKQNVELSADQVFDLTKENYPHQLTIASITDEQGLARNTSDLNVETLMLTARYLPADSGENIYYQFFNWIQGNKPLRMTQGNDQFALSFSAVVFDQGSGPKTFYKLQHQPTDLNLGKTWHLDQRTMGKLQFENGDPVQVAQGITQFVGHYGPLGGAATAPAPLFEKVSFQAFAEMSSYNQDSRFLSIFSATPSDWSGRASGPLAFDNTTNFIKIKGGYSPESYMQQVYRSPDNNLSMTQGALFSAMQIGFDNYSDLVNVQPDVYGPDFMLKDEQANYYAQAMPTRLQCDSQSTETEFAQAYEQQRLPFQCSQLNITYSYTTAFDGETTESNVSITTSGQTPVAALSEVEFTDNGITSRVLSSATAQLSFTLRLWEQPFIASSVQVAYRINGNETWLPLQVSLQNSRYRVKLPVLVVGGIASFKIQFEDQNGNQAIHELNSVVVLQSELTNYQLTVSKTGAGAGTVTSAPAAIDCGSICSASLAQSSSITLTATPDSQSVFVGWQGPCSDSSSQCQFSLQQNTAVHARFEPKTLTPQLTSNAEGGMVLPQTPSVAYGESMIYRVVPAAGFKVKLSVKGDCPVGEWLNATTYQSGPITSACSIQFEFIKATRKGLPLWWFITPPSPTNE